MLYYDIIDKYQFLIETASVHKQSPLHAHNEYEIYCLIRGNREYFIDNAYYPLQEGDFVLIPKGHFHHTLGSSCRRILIAFTDEFLLQYYTPRAIEHLLKAFDYPHVRPMEKDLNRINVILSSIKELFTVKDDEIFVLLAELLDILSRSPTVENHTPKPIEQVAKITEYVEKHYMEINSIQDIANEFFLNKSYLCRLFKKVTNLPFSVYLNKIKLRQAAQMLVTTNKKISLIAEECGFHSCAYFSNMFQKEYDIAPSKYRKRKAKIK